MSANRIIVGVLIGICLLTGLLAAVWHFSLLVKWVALTLLIVAGLLGGLIGEIQSRKALAPYWSRICTGIRWRRRFPDSAAPEIREFLNIFVAAFGFGRRRRSCFLPDDKVMDVYRALYPSGSLVDSLELEDLARCLKKRYRIDFAVDWRGDITLGELYEQTRAQAN